MRECGAVVLQDAAFGGLSALLVGLVALAVDRGRTAAAFGGLATLGLLAGDLVRAGTSTNSMVTAAFYTLGPDMAAQLPLLRSGGRVFTCEPHGSRSFARAVVDRIAADRPLDPWSYGALVQTLTPNTNVPLAIPTAFGIDHTMFFPLSRVMDASEADCDPFPAIADRLVRAGVHHVISLEPLDEPGLDLRGTARPPAVDPLTVHVYALEDSLPLRRVASSVRTAPDPGRAQARADLPFLRAGGVVIEDPGPETSGVTGDITSLEETPGHLRVAVVASAATAVVVRDSFAKGWSARVNGEATPVRRADGRHLAVRVPAGRSEVSLRYFPPHLRPGVLLALLAGAATVWLWRRKS
jgi:hypothetical protein